MFTTAVRCLAKKVKPRGPRVVQPKADQVGLADIVRGVLREHGPMTVTDCWKHAQQEGVKSKRQMKLMLRWLKERDDLKVTCHHLSAGEKGSFSSKEFLFALSTKNAGQPAASGNPRSGQEESSPQLPL